MKIVRKISDNTVYFLEEDTTPITLGSNLTVGRSVVPTFSSSEYEIIEAVDAPGDWVSGGLMAYDSAWSVADQSAFDAVIAARATADAAAAERANVRRITKRQLFKQMKVIDKWDGLKLALAANEFLLDYFDAASHFEIDEPEVISMSVSLSIDRQQFFNDAAQL